MCSDNQENNGDSIGQQVKDAVSEAASGFGVDASVVPSLVAVAIQSYTQHVIGRMVTRLMEPGVVDSMGAMDLVNCITKLVRLLPGDLVKPVVKDLVDKLSNVDLESLANPSVPTDPLHPTPSQASPQECTTPQIPKL